MKPAFVSVVMPTFNSLRHVAEAVRSVQAQNHEHWELLIVDGGSTDGTQELIRRLAAQDQRVRLLPNPDDKGPAHARCTGVRAAGGTYVAFLDADDFWLPEKLEKQVSFMRHHNVRFSYARYRSMLEDGSRVGCLTPMRSSFNFAQALRGRGIGTLTVMVERSMLTPDVIEVWRRAGGEEYLWWLLMLRKGITAHLLDQDLARYRNTGGSLSKNVRYTLRSVWRMYRDDLKLPLREATPSYLSYLLSAGIRKGRVRLCEKMKDH